MAFTGGLAGKVLVVDDDVNFHRLAESALGPMGFECVCVKNGEDALRLMKEGLPRALLLDGLLPGIRGDEVAARLRKVHDRRRLPIVFVSSFFRDLKSRLHLTNTCEVDLVLHKPLTPEELRRALAQIPALAPVTQHPGLAHELELELELELEEPEAPEVPSPALNAPELVAAFVASARERILSMRASLAALGGPNHATALDALRNEAHRFHGGGATFGFPEISRLGARLEALLAESADVAAPTSRARVTGLVEALAGKVARMGANAPIGTEVPAEVRPNDVWLIDGPGELSLSCREAARRGQRVQVFEELEPALAAAAHETPEVVFVAGDRSGLDGFGATERLAAAGIGPLVLMLRGARLADRLEALRRGAAGTVHRLSDAQALLRAARSFARPQVGATVLAVDSDLARLGELAELLAPHRLTVEPCTEPEELFPALHRVNPMLLVIAEPLPRVRGVDLARAVRAEARWRELPVLLLADRAELAALEAGAEVLVRPFESAELATRIRVSAFRQLFERSESSIDLTSGAYGLSYLREACERSLLLARRGRTLALLLFEADLGRLEATLERDELVAALAARLRLAFRSTDVLARVGEDRFAVLLHDATRADAARLLEENLRALAGPSLGRAAFPAAVRGACASFPEVSGGFDELFRVAAAQLSR